MNEVWKDFLSDAKDFDLSSFEVNDVLNPKLWNENNELNSRIRAQLLKIAKDFFESLELDGVGIDDITLTGSLANYNWSEYSDADLHILLDFDLIDIEEDLLKDYLRAKQGVWNKKHDIRIQDHEVEIYVQDSNEPHAAMSVYSILNDNWNKSPSKVDPIIDFGAVTEKSSSLMEEIDRACDLFCDKKYEETVDYVERLREKIRKFRKCGLDKGGEFSVENIAFKVLRRNGYLKKLSDLAIKSYDKQMSMNGDHEAHWNNFKDQVEEDYQQDVKRKHFSKKKDLIGKGEEPNSPPYSEKPSYKRSKSAPVGFGGA